MPVKRHIPAALSLAALLCASAVPAAYAAQAAAPAAPTAQPATPQPAAGAAAAAPAAGGPVDMVHAKQTFESSCSACHEPSLATGLRNNRQGWTALVDRMVGFGLTASDAQLHEIVEYLTATYPAP